MHLFTVMKIQYVTFLNEQSFILFLHKTFMKGGKNVKMWYLTTTGGGSAQTTPLLQNFIVF